MALQSIISKNRGSCETMVNIAVLLLCIIKCISTQCSCG